MAENGCKHITIGIENGSEKVLHDLGKPQRLEKVSKIIAWCKQAGVTPYFLFILFCPTATRQDLEEAWGRMDAWIKEGATISIEPNMMCYRGSPLWDSTHTMLYHTEGLTITPSLYKRKALRFPYRVLPDDKTTRKIANQFNAAWPEYLGQAKIDHQFKGATGRLMVNLLGKILHG